MEAEGDTAVDAPPAPPPERLVPWVEKFRPRTVEEVAHQEEVVHALQASILSGKLPHLLFYGPPGTGKTSTILAVAKQIFGHAEYSKRVLELNASDERSISVVREKVKGFASTTVGSASLDGKKLPPFKLIILDEADSMTQDAQSALRRTMELYTRVTRFCLICNYVSRIIEPLASRCAKFRFQPLSSESFTKKIKEIAEKENLKIDNAAVTTIVNVSKGDMRTGITLLQSSAQYNQGQVTSEVVLETAGIPEEDVMKGIWDALKTGKITNVLQQADEINAEGFSLMAICKLFQEQLIDLPKTELDESKKAAILMKLADVDAAIEEGADEDLQFRSFLAQTAVKMRK